MELEIIDEEQLLPEKFLPEVRNLVELGGKKIGHAPNTEISINFVSDATIRQINQKYRHKDRVTDVISFAIEDGEDPGLLQYFKNQGIPRDLGDLFIAPNYVFKQAQELDHSQERELGYTVVHGLLHLSGYDHIEETEAAKMMALQEEILKSYGLAK